MKKIYILLICIYFIYCNVYGWSGKTHQSISEKATFESKIRQICNKLNFCTGLNHHLITFYDNKMNSKSILEWIVCGAQVEDQDIAIRSNNHFHNPIRTLEHAGLSDYHYPKGGESLLLWAQDGDYQSKFKEGDNSWNKIREYFFNGMISNDIQTRNDNFALMFKGLGHQIHLIQDAAVPDHARNDSHLLNTYKPKNNNSWRCIEGWAENDDAYIRSFLSEIIKPNFAFNENLDYQGKKLVPITKLVDTLNYFMYKIPSSGVDQGLAEYTNANFVSEDTIFTDNLDPLADHYSPFPKITSTNYNEPFFAESKNKNNETEIRSYLSKIGDGENIKYFLRWNYFEHWLVNKANPNNLIDYVYLDDWCHYEYCKLLIPRAAGFSTTLLDYFFRGEIDIQLPEEDGIYGLAPYPEQGFKQITIKAKNMTPDEEMMGKLFLVIRYRPSAGDDWDSPTPARPYQEQEKFIVAEYPEQSVTIPSNEYKKLQFDLPTSLPVSATDVNITLVMHGTLGYEKDIAVAIGFKDISEPTAIEICNDSDMICLNGVMMPYWNPTVLDYAETTKRDDIITPGEIDIIPRTIKLWEVIFFDMMPPVPPNRIYFDFAAAPEYDWVEIEAGQSYRMHILTDEGKKTIFRFGYTCKRPSDTIVGYDPPWFTPGYSACNYIWYHMQRPFEITPRQNKLVWNEGAKQFDHVKTDNFYWETKGRYFLNLIYMAQPDAPRNCTTCDPCKTHYPVQGQPWKAQYYDNLSPALREEQIPFVQLLKNRNASGD